MRIGVIVAMDKELDLFQDIMNFMEINPTLGTKVYYGRIGKHEVFLCKSGIGKVNAALITSKLIIDYNLNYVINSGVAGSLSENLKPGSLVIANGVCFHDVWCGEGTTYGQSDTCPLYFTPDVLGYSKLYDMFESTNGLVVSGDKFITTQKDVFDIKDNFPEAIACDMESGAISQTCFKYNVPFIVVKILSDMPGCDDHITNYNKFWETASSDLFKIVVTFIENYGQN